MLSITKKELFRMKIEFRQIFAEFFGDGFGELGKTIAVKLYAMDLCDKRFG